jgi:deoxycytidine triphosphate deaminase
VTDNPTSTDRYAPSEDEARSRFSVWRAVDPYPRIEPALLNAADIADYVAAAGLIHPFDETKLKPASYPLALGGKILWWDNKSRKERVVELDEGDKFELQPNSIAFVTLHPLLQLPDYLAVRFNLRIQNIYRGLLLGTGPLVDPGFVGHLSFPLHNLTTNSYPFRGAENVVWVEFTKLSRSEAFEGEISAAPARAGKFKSYSPPADRNDVEDYVAEALRGVGSRHVWSSISEALRDAHEAVRRATWVNVAGGVALVVLAVSVLAVVATLLWNEWNQPRTSDVRRDEQRIVQLERTMTQLQSQLKSKSAKTKNKP